MAAQPTPLSLKIVAWLFIFSGLCAVIEILLSLTQHHLNINLGVLGILIGRGLLNFKSGWRTCGLVFIVFGLILVPIFCCIVLFSNTETVDFQILGLHVGQANAILMVAATIPFYALLLWEFRVLTKPDIKELFSDTAAISEAEI